MVRRYFILHVFRGLSYMAPAIFYKKFNDRDLFFSVMSY